MNGRFLKFKRTFFRIRLLKSLLLGISSLLLFGGAWLLLWDFGALKASPWIAAPIGLGVGLTVFAVLFLSLRLSDEDIAARLDERFGLKERTQTMLQYGNEKGAVIELQREDAANELRRFEAKELGFKWLALCIAALLVSASVAVCALICIPPSENAGSNEEPDYAFAITEKQIAQLRELIEDVRASEMQSPYKESTVKNLETLLDDLKSIELYRQMVTRVESSVSDIEEIVDSSENIREIYDAIVSQDDEIADIVAEYLAEDDWVKCSEISAKLLTALTNQTSDVGLDDAKKKDELKKKLENTAAYISLALAFSDADEDGDLYKSLAKLVNADEENAAVSERVLGLSKLAKQVNDNTYEWSCAKISTLLTVMQAEIYVSMEPERLNVSVGERAIERLCAIFGITLSDDDGEDKKEDQTQNPNPDDEKGDGASAGDGHKYPTDDKVYDIGSDKLVPYGNLWAIYNDKINNVTDEEKKEIYEKYFKILFNGFEEDSTGATGK